MPLVINEGVVTTVMLDPGLGHQVINTCLSVDAPDDGSDMIDKGHGFGDRIYKILLHLQSKTMALLDTPGQNTRLQTYPGQWWSLTRTFAATVGPYSPPRCLVTLLISSPDSHSPSTTTRDMMLQG